MSALEFYLHNLTTASEGGGGEGGTSNYQELTNKPKVNGNTLVGNKSAADLGLATPSDISTAIAQMLATKFIVLSQEEYSALTEKDPTVFYFIKEV